MFSFGLTKFDIELSLCNKCTIKGVTITTLHYSKSKQFQDCTGLYRRKNVHDSDGKLDELFCVASFRGKTSMRRYEIW